MNLGQELFNLQQQMKVQQSFPVDLLLFSQREQDNIISNMDRIIDQECYKSLQYFQKDQRVQKLLQDIEQKAGGSVIKLKQNIPKLQKLYDEMLGCIDQQVLLEEQKQMLLYEEQKTQYETKQKHRIEKSKENQQIQEQHSLKKQNEVVNQTEAEVDKLEIQQKNKQQKIHDNTNVSVDQKSNKNTFLKPQQKIVQQSQNKFSKKQQQKVGSKLTEQSEKSIQKTGQKNKQVKIQTKCIQNIPSPKKSNDKQFKQLKQEQKITPKNYNQDQDKIILNAKEIQQKRQSNNQKQNEEEIEQKNTSKKSIDICADKTQNNIEPVRQQIQQCEVINELPVPPAKRGDYIKQVLKKMRIKISQFILGQFRPSAWHPSSDQNTFQGTISSLYSLYQQKYLVSHNLEDLLSKY